MNKAQYDEYMDSPEWKRTTEIAKLIANNRCQVCNKDKPFISSHHRSYTHIGKAEEFFDLVVLCNDCHELYHEKILADKENELAKASRKKVVPGGVLNSEGLWCCSLCSYKCNPGRDADMHRRMEHGMKLPRIGLLIRLAFGADLTPVLFPLVEIAKAHKGQDRIFLEIPGENSREKHEPITLAFDKKHMFCFCKESMKALMDLWKENRVITRVKLVDKEHPYDREIAPAKSEPILKEGESQHVQ